MALFYNGPTHETEYTFNLKTLTDQELIRWTCKALAHVSDTRKGNPSSWDYPTLCIVHPHIGAFLIAAHKEAKRRNAARRFWNS